MRKFIYLILIIISISSYFLITRKINITSDGFNNCKLVMIDEDNIKNQILQSTKNETILDFSFLKNRDSFIGFSLNLKDSILNLKKTPNIYFNIKNTNTEFITVYLYTELKHNSFGIPEAILEKDIYLKNEDGNYEIHLSDFEIKDWWYTLNGIDIKNESIMPNLKRVKALGFGLSKTPNIPINKRLKIQLNDISVSRPHSLWWSFGGLSLVILIYLAIIDLLKKQNFILKGVESSKFLDIEKSDQISQKMVQFIGRYYGNSKLSIHHAADAANVSHDQIDSILKKHYQLSFKQYLTNVRLTEAKRLLVESECSIKEISSIVGFSNVSVFNRTLKSDTGKTPSELRSLN